MAEVRSLLEEEGNPALKLRVYVTGGGCSGFQYGFSFDEEFAEDVSANTKPVVASKTALPPLATLYLAPLFEMVGRAGFEPATNWLKANCSTD